jgi:HEAT repeat protein
MHSEVIRSAIVIISTCLCFAAAGAKGQATQQESAAEQAEPPKLKEARELAGSRDLRNTHRLLALLKDSDERVRIAAAEALGFVLHRYAVGPGLSMGDDEPHPLDYLGYKITAPFLVSGYRSALLHALSDPSPKVRAATLRTLGEIFEGTGGEEAKEAPDDVARAILPFLNDPNHDLASAAVDAVQKIEIREAIPGLMALLQRPNPEIRLKSLYTLNWTNVVRPKAVTPFVSLQKETVPFIRLLKDPDAKVRQQASYSLDFMCRAELCDAPTVPALLDALEDTSTRYGAVEALLFLKDPRTVQPVLATLDRDAAQDAKILDHTLTYRLPEFLNFAGYDTGVKRIFGYLRNGSRNARWAAARAIVNMKIPEGKQALEAALQQDDETAWGLADFSEIDIAKIVEFLGLDVTVQVEMLGRQLRKGPASVRARSAILLGSLHDRRAAPLLLEALKDSDSEVLSAIIRALPEVVPEVGDKHAMERLRQIASLPDPALLDTLQQQVPKLRDPETFGIALAVLRNQAVSTSIVCALLPRMCEGRWEFNVHPNLFESREVLRAKLNWLKTGDSRTTRPIAGALVIAGAPEAVQPLSLLLKHPEAKVRADAAGALFWMCVDGLCDDAVVPSLLEALGDKATRGNVARTLAYLSKREAAQAVFLALEEDVAQDTMGLAEYWEADVRNMMDFLGKDNMRKLLELYHANGSADARRQAERFQTEIANP